MAATRLTCGPPETRAGGESGSSPASSAIWAMVSVGMGLVYKRRVECRLAPIVFWQMPRKVTAIMQDSGYFHAAIQSTTI